MSICVAPFGASRIDFIAQFRLLIYGFAFIIHLGIPMNLLYANMFTTLWPYSLLPTSWTSIKFKFNSNFKFKWNGTVLTEPFKFFVVDTRRWNIRAGSVSFSLSDDSSMAAVASAMACVTSFGSGDGVRDEDEPIDGIDSGDLL